MRITQNYNLLLKELIVAAELQFDLNQLFTVINSIDKDNLARPGSVFDWGNTKLNNVNDPLGEIGDSTDLQVAVTKNWLKAKLFAAGKFFDPATGNWHLHTNKATIDLITSAGDGAIPSAAERARFLTQNEKDALTAASTPTGANPVATIADLTGVTPSVITPIYSSWGWNAALAAGASIGCTAMLNLSAKTLFVGKVRGRVYNGAVNGEGEVDIVAGYDGVNVFIFSDGTLPQLLMSDTSELFTGVTGAGGGVYPRVQVLSDATPIEIGRLTGTATGGILATKSAGTPDILFSVVNSHTSALPAKVDAFGYQK